MLALFIASALLGSGIVFHHKRMLTYIAFAGILLEAQLLLASYIHRTTLSSFENSSFFLLAGIAYLTLWLSMYKQWKSPYATPGSGIRDGFVAIALVLVAGFAYPVLHANGYAGENFVLHGFYNGDVATFASLIQKSFDTASLVAENPFSGNGYLEYPTLLHGAFADFFTMMGIGKDWLRFLSLMVYIQIIITIPMFFLLWDTVWGEPKNPAEKWFGISSRIKVYSLQTLIALFAIGLSIDSFAYPQSHFFLMGMFLAAVALLAQGSLLSGRNQVLFVAAGFIFAALLLFSNTVTGTVAIACAGTLCVLRMFDKKRPVRERAIFLVLAFLLVFFMIQASTGRETLRNPHFSVSAASDMIRAGITALFVLGAAFISLSRKQFLSLASAIVATLGLSVFFLSDRNIVTENASRFLYHSFLIGFALLLPLVIQVKYWIYRELFLTSRPMSERIGGYLIAISSVLLLLLPVGISAGSTYRSLLVEEPRIITQNDRVLLWWIDEHTSPNDIIITNGYEPYTVPLFTGRALLRTEGYWLSADDDISNQIQKAYAGDMSAQQDILQSAQYIIIPKNAVEMWDVTGLKKASDNGTNVLYKITSS